MSHVHGSAGILQGSATHEIQWPVLADYLAFVALGLPNRKKCDLQRLLTFQASSESEAVSAQQGHKSPTGRAFFPTAEVAIHSSVSEIECFDCWCR
jgi:hypothetical protein